MLTDSDVGRIEEIMLRITAVREKRGYIPDRDEDKIAEILQRGEDAARIQHELLVESSYGFASPVRIRDRAMDSEDPREFGSLSRWKNREIDS